MRIYFLKEYNRTNTGKVIISRIVYREEGYIMSSGKSSKKQRKTRKRTQTGSGGAYALSKLFGRGKNQMKRKGTQKGTRKGTQKGTQKQTGGSKSWKNSRLRRDLKAALSFI